jgi:hypothetical protein
MRMTDFGAIEGISYQLPYSNSPPSMTLWPVPA